MSPKKSKPHLVADTTLENVDPDEMAFAVQLFQAGLRLRMPMESPEKKGIDFGDGELAQGMLDALPEEIRDQFVIRDTRMAPKDNPLHRAAFGVLAHYAKHPQREAIFGRAMAFYWLVNQVDRAVLAKWEKPCEEDEEAVMLHPAVVEAVATAPASKHGVFKEKQFFVVVEKIAAEKYTDE